MKKFYAALALSSALFGAVPAWAADDFVAQCVSAAASAGQPAGAAQSICQCMVERAAGGQAALESLRAAAQLPPEQRDAALTPRAREIRDACRAAVTQAN